MGAAACAAAISRATGLCWILLNYCGFWFDHRRLIMLFVKVTQIRLNFGVFDFLHKLIEFRKGGNDLIVLEAVHGGLGGAEGVLFQPGGCVLTKLAVTVVRTFAVLL